VNLNDALYTRVPAGRIVTNKQNMIAITYHFFGNDIYMIVYHFLGHDIDMI
jgi:hypothetical protein